MKTINKAAKLDISVYIHSDDMKMFQAIVNQGIDARLEGFTKSTFYQNCLRYYFDFAPSEIQILLRRMLAIEKDIADMWATDIVACYYGYETA